MTTDAKKRVRAQLQTKEVEKTAWDLLTSDEILEPPDPPVDVTGAVYVKKPRPSRYIDPYDLPKLPTRVLMRYLASARACGNDAYDPTGSNYKTIPSKAIKAELAKRPHMPSKREGSQLRAKKAKTKHGKSKAGRPHRIHPATRTATALVAAITRRTKETP